MSAIGAHSLNMGYIPNMLSKRRFNRRLHAISKLFLTLLLHLGETWKKLNEYSPYTLDGFQIPVCDNYRIYRLKIYQGEGRPLCFGCFHQPPLVATLVNDGDPYFP